MKLVGRQLHSIQRTQCYNIHHHISWKQRAIFVTNLRLEIINGGEEKGAAVDDDRDRKLKHFELSGLGCR